MCITYPPTIAVQMSAVINDAKRATNRHQSRIHSLSESNIVSVYVCVYGYR